MASWASSDKGTGLIGGATQHQRFQKIFPDIPTFSNTIELNDRERISTGPFTITPYLMDHSAYDAYAFLVEAEDKRRFSTLAIFSRPEREAV